MRIYLFIWILLHTVCFQIGNAQNQPNIILILADDMGYADIGVNGQTEIQTPVLDRMAAEGMKLTNFYSGTPVCAPARCNIMTGMHHSHCRIKGNSVNNELLPEDVTIAEVLNFGGYVTGGFGKWGLGNNNNQGIPSKQGFDHFTGYWDQLHAHNFWATYLMDDGDTLNLKNVNPNQGARGQGNAPSSGELEYTHTVIANKALSFIDTYKDTTFFLYAPFTIPHLNNEGSGAEDGGFEVPSLGQYADKNNWTTPMKSLAAMMTLMDEDIGRILDKLKEHKIDHKTLVFFTSDNGPSFLKVGPRQLPDGTPLSAEERIIANWFDSNGSFRGYKQDTFEGGIRMPTLVWWPGFIEAGSTFDRVSYHPDILPTLADFAGVSKPTNIDGISLANSFLGRTQIEEHNHLFIKLGPDVAVIKGDWKLVTERVDGNPSQTYLYNIKDDPGETNDLSAQNPDILKELKDIEALEDGEKQTANWSAQKITPIAPVGGTSIQFGRIFLNPNIQIINHNLSIISDDEHYSNALITLLNAKGEHKFYGTLSKNKQITLPKNLRGIYWVKIILNNKTNIVKKMLVI